MGGEGKGENKRIAGGGGYIAIIGCQKREGRGRNPKSCYTRWEKEKKNEEFHICILFDPN